MEREERASDILVLRTVFPAEIWLYGAGVSVATGSDLCSLKRK